MVADASEIVDQNPSCGYLKCIPMKLLGFLSQLDHPIDSVRQFTPAWFTVTMVRSAESLLLIVLPASSRLPASSSLGPPLCHNLLTCGKHRGQASCHSFYIRSPTHFTAWSSWDGPFGKPDKPLLSHSFSDQVVGSPGLQCESDCDPLFMMNTGG